jgi:DNA-binding response OmpR family regulator
MERNKPLRSSRRRRSSWHEAQRQRLHLLPGPPLAGYQIQRNEENHTVVINGLMVRCTPDEYALLLTLMERYEQPVLFDELIALFRDASLEDPALLKAARRKLTCTLSDLRTKLWPTDFTIVRVVDTGYLLLHQDKLWSLTHADLNDPDEHL